jgi:hypothetical protein
MSYGDLVTLNNEAAARRCAFRKTPYVPWNIQETGESGFANRIPYIGDECPKGWERLFTEGGDVFDSVAAIRNTLKRSDIYGCSLGFAFVEPIAGKVGLATFRPLDEAHEPQKAYF